MVVRPRSLRPTTHLTHPPPDEAPPRKLQVSVTSIERGRKKEKVEEKKDGRMVRKKTQKE